MEVIDVLVTAGLAVSRSEAVRLVRQGAVFIDNERATDPNAEITGRTYVRVGQTRTAHVDATGDESLPQ